MLVVTAGFNAFSDSSKVVNSVPMEKEKTETIEQMMKTEIVDSPMNVVY
jgi:hypothetical protein